MPSASGVTSPYTITGLAAGTRWDVRVRVDAPALGPWSGTVQGEVPAAGGDGLGTQALGTSPLGGSA